MVGWMINCKIIPEIRVEESQKAKKKKSEKKVGLKSLAQTHMAEICNPQDWFFLFRWFSLYHSFLFVSFLATFGDESDLIEK